MDEESNKEPRERMRDIFEEDNEGQIPKYEQQPQPPEQEQPASPPTEQLQVSESQSPAQPQRQQPQASSQSILDLLPKPKQPVQMPAQVEAKAEEPKPVTPAPVVETPKPASQLDLGSVLQKKKPAQPEQLPTPPVEQQPAQKPAPLPTEQPAKQAENTKEKPSMSRKEKLLRALWTTTSVISMTVNIIVVTVLILAFGFLRGFKLPPNIDIFVLNNLLSGLYSNFEKMDQATIQTVIPVDAQIPLDISVPVQTTTQITLAESVVIPNAQVVINTGGLNINSNARVTLPAGTPLDVNLNFVLPVQTSIPVHLEVPVNIPMAETELHEPFVGLQEVVKPLYCLLEPAAVSSISGEPVCK